MQIQNIDPTSDNFLVDKKKLELSADLVYVVAAYNYLYGLDENKVVIHKIGSDDTKKSDKITLSDPVTTFQVNDKTGDIICARPVDNSISIMNFKNADFENFSQNVDQITFSSTNKYNPPVQGSNITISPELKYIGFTCGNDIYVYTSPFTARSKPWKITQDEKITNLILTDSGYVFYTTENSVTVYNLNAKDNPSQKLIATGVKPKFAFMSENKKLHVLQDKTISIISKSTYNGQDKFEIQVKPITTDNSNYEISMFGPMGSYVYLGINYSIGGSFSVFDLTYDIKCFSGDYGQKTDSVSRLWGAMIIRQKKDIYFYRELQPMAKVNIMLGRKRFEKAIKMAKDYDLGEVSIAQTHREYGDYLFERQKYQEAINEYIATVRFTEPSYVIAKFVDPHHANLLAQYLQAIPNDLKSKQHTTLLFNCYTKIKAGNELNDFVQSLIKKANSDEKSFDVETAVDVLKRNGYQQLAKELAKAYNKHSLYISLLYERQEYKEMLDYIKTLPGEEVQPKLQEYGTEIISKYPDGRKDLIQFATDCCTKGVKFGNDETVKKVDPAALSPIFVKSPEEHFRFLYSLKSNLNEQCWNTLIELALRTKSDLINDLLNDPQARYTREQVIIYLNAFGHKEGLPHQYEELKLYPFLLHAAPPEDVLQICEKYGQEMPKLWSDGLIALADSNCKEEILSAFLDKLMETGTIPFLTILTVLRTHGKHSFAAVSKLVKTVFSNEQAKLREANERKKKSLERAAADRADAEKLLTMNYVINGTKNCASCHETIGDNDQSQAIHFLCGHSFHKYCNNSEFCPLCKDRLDDILNKKKKKLEQAKMDVDVQSYNFDTMLNDISESLFSGGVSSELGNEASELNKVNELLEKVRGSTRN